ncbi:TB2/DP1, HVA22 family [Musa troglodytarum]|uniref:HVA22-like protein n=1 Tax=Musa troglodytarum TaxID=320322 RepID=A0A9E7JDI4_9LILI|nr:TB2/DP1, HVA22 family [Musa troglodytarum]
MIGSFLSRALILVFGYAYPAYACYKTVELNKPEIEKLRFWCQYWILIALLAVLERFGDVFFSWMPMYCEAKLALYIYLWNPKLRGTTYVYDTFFRPYIAKHETEIDRNLLELRARVSDIMFMFWQKAASYGQTSFFEILNYFSLLLQAQRSQPSQPQELQQAHQFPSPEPPVDQPATSQQPQHETRMLPSLIKNQPQEQSRKFGAHLRAASPVQPHQFPSPVPPADQPTRSQTPRQETKVQPSPIKNKLQAASAVEQPESGPGTDSSQTANQPSPSEEPMQVDPINSQDMEHSSNPPSEETTTEEAIRVTHSRLRKRAAIGAAGPV